MKNLKKLYIIGASGLGREIESWLELEPIESRNWQLNGYLDINNCALKTYPTDYDIICSELEHVFRQNDIVLVAISEVSIKEKVFKFLESNKIEIFTFVSQKAIIGKFCKIGKGSIVCPNSVITTNVELGKGVLLNCGSQVGHDCKIGNFTSINSNVDIAGKCNIGNKVFLGSNSTIIPSRKVGNNAKIGAGSIVIKNVKENVSVFGNPAIKIM